MIPSKQLAKEKDDKVPRPRCAASDSIIRSAPSGNNRFLSKVSKFLLLLPLLLRALLIFSFSVYSLCLLLLLLLLLPLLFPLHLLILLPLPSCCILFPFSINICQQRSSHLYAAASKVCLKIYPSSNILGDIKDASSIKEKTPNA